LKTKLPLNILLLDYKTLTNICGYWGNCSYIYTNKKLMGTNTKQLITEYVYKNYKTYRDKQLIINEFDKCYHILLHKDASPLILSKGILK
jgi:hypothetical protein